MQITSNQAVRVLQSIHQVATNSAPKHGISATNPEKDKVELSAADFDFDRKLASSALGKLVDEMAQKISGIHGVVETNVSEQARGEKGLEGGVPELTRTQAQELLDGYFSAENTAQRIFDFAFSFFTGEQDRGEYAEEMKNYIDEGFRQAEKLLGGLADISLDTHDLINKKIDEFVNEGKEEDEKAPPPKGDGPPAVPKDEEA